jgi:serine/threonine kinase 32
MRQVEEQFTSYDFKKMQRRSYYPQNQQIMTTVTATSSMGMVPSRPVTPIDGMRVDSIPARMTDEYARSGQIPYDPTQGPFPYESTLENRAPIAKQQRLQV